MYNLKILALGPGQIGKSTFLFRLLGLIKGNIDTVPLKELPSCSTGQADLREVCIKFVTEPGDRSSVYLSSKLEGSVA